MNKDTDRHECTKQRMLTKTDLEGSMKSEFFQFKTRLKADPSAVFAWHERPGAFESLSPPWVDVEVVERTGGILDGGEVLLSIGRAPLNVRWRLMHRDYIRGEQFKDVQISGPFESWTHTHKFTAQSDGGCVLEDTIEFQLPQLPLPWLPGFLIKEELRRMFNYREDILTHQVALEGQEEKCMQVAITGSHGLIGSTLVPLLTTRGHQVRRMVRRGNDGKEAGKTDIEWSASSEWDADTHLQGVDAVVHLAGESIASGRWTDEKKRAIRDSRIEGTRALSECIAKMKNPPRVLVCASAIGFYGDRGDSAVDESDSSGEGFLSELCVDWEASADAARAAGVRVVNARIGVVLSPRGGALAKMLPPFQMGAGGKIGSGKQYMSWIAIDDVAGAILHCLTNDAIEGPVNLVAPHAVTNDQFTRGLGAVLHRPTIFPVPDFAARLAFGEMADELLLASTRVVPEKLDKGGYKFMYPQIEDALRHVLGR